ncbi:MAG: hypothetical protein Q9219_006897 [cf. Caloplaca sp. 3 TL-2023]
MAVAFMGGHGIPRNQLDPVHRIEESYQQPHTAATCASDVILGSTDQRPVAFPVPPSVQQDNLSTTLLPVPAFPVTGITRAEILQIPGSALENRLYWTEIPQSYFAGSAMRAIVLLPSDPLYPNQSEGQPILTCSLNAGRGSSTLNVSTQKSGSDDVRSRISKSKDDGWVLQALMGGADNKGHSFAFFEPPIYPERSINLTQNWLQYLNPRIEGLNTTLFHHLMQANLSDSKPEKSARIILANLLANGLGRIGAGSSIQGELKMEMDSDGNSIPVGNYWFQGKGDSFAVDPMKSKDWVIFKVISTYETYAYNTAGVGPKVAIVSLLLYCTIAIGHTCYAGISGISSTCWDSIGEVVTLAMNSAPTSLLRNTSSGIAGTNIFKYSTLILAKPDEESEGEHLELVVGEPDEKTVERRRLKVNRDYG